MSTKKRIHIKHDFDESGESAPTRLVVAERLKDSGRSWEKLAEEAGLCEETVVKFANFHTKNPQSETLYKLARVVGVDLSPHDAESGQKIQIPARLMKQVREARAKRAHGNNVVNFPGARTRPKIRRRRWRAG